MNDQNCLTHITWNCKYHVMLALKYRRKAFYGAKRREIVEILRTLCNRKKVKIVETEVCPDHVHMLMEIPPEIAVSSFMGYLKQERSGDIRPTYKTKVKNEQAFSTKWTQSKSIKAPLKVWAKQLQKIWQTARPALKNSRVSRYDRAKRDSSPSEGAVNNNGAIIRFFRCSL